MAISSRMRTSSVRSRDRYARLLAHLGQHRAEQDRGANRLQGVFGTDHHGGRRAPADALQSREHFGDDGAALLERATQRAFLILQRLDARLVCGQALLDVLYLGGAVDQRLVEFAAIFAESVSLSARSFFSFSSARFCSARIVSSS